MATYLFIGVEPRTFPGSPLQVGRGPFEPGEHIEADENPDPKWFDEVKVPDTRGNPDVSAQVQDDGA